MVSLSQQLTLLTRGGKLNTANDRRSAAQALAVALALDPANNGARENLSTLTKGKNLDRANNESLNAAKGRIWKMLTWLSMPQAGSDGNTLAALIGDSISVLGSDHSDAVKAGGSGEQGTWQGWVAPLSAFEEDKLVSDEPIDEIEPDKPTEELSSKPDPKASVVLEKADLKAVLHTYDSLSNKWSFGLSTVKMEASRESPVVEVDPEHEVDDRERKEFEILVPSAVSSEHWRIERMVVSSIRQALSDYRGELPKKGQIRLLAGDGNYSFKKNHSYLSGPGFILANAALSGIEPQGTVLAELDRNNNMVVPPYFWRQLTALSEEKVGRLIVPVGAEEYLLNLLVIENPEFFLNNEVLMASSKEEFIALCAKEPSEEHAAVFAMFQELAAKAEGNPIGPFLSNRFVRQRLEEIVAEAPYHLSAKILASDRPQFLTRKVLAAEIWRVIDPLNEFTDLDQEDTDTVEFEKLYDKIRDSLENLEHYAEIRDRELVNEGKDLASKIRSFLRTLRGRGELWERYSEIYAARREMIAKNYELRQKLSEASGDPLPEDLDNIRRVPVRRRVR